MKEVDNKIKRAIEGCWEVPPIPDGHEARFARKLDRNNVSGRHGKMWQIITVFTVAASLLVTLFLWKGTNEGDGSVDTLSMVKGYYAALIWEESEYIERITENMSPSERENLLTEVKYIKKEADSIADNVIKSVQNEDEKIHYMIVVYSSHLRSLQKLSAYLQPASKK